MNCAGDSFESYSFSIVANSREKAKATAAAERTAA
jgi:hypothetical protein